MITSFPFILSVRSCIDLWSFTPWSLNSTDHLPQASWALCARLSQLLARPIGPASHAGSFKDTYRIIVIILLISCAQLCRLRGMRRSSLICRPNAESIRTTSTDRWRWSVPLFLDKWCHWCRLSSVSYSQVKGKFILKFEGRMGKYLFFLKFCLNMFQRDDYLTESLIASIFIPFRIYNQYPKITSPYPSFIRGRCFNRFFCDWWLWGKIQDFEFERDMFQNSYKLRNSKVSSITIRSAWIQLY